MKIYVIICDLDGTLCDVEHRRKYVDGTIDPKDWEAFYSGLSGDKPNFWCMELIRSMSQGTPIVYVTGRPEKWRDATNEWLLEHRAPNCQHLFMRKNGDFRPDTVVKEEILKRDILPENNVLFALDDRSSVVKMWRENGITCLQCDEGNF